MEQTKTVEEIKNMFPSYSHEYRDGYHWVGVRDTVKKNFIIAGTGSTEEEAWQETYEWLTRTGRYDPTVDYHYNSKSEDFREDPETSSG